MQKIEGEELQDLVKAAAGELIRQKRDEAISMIKSKLNRIAALTSEIKKIETDKKKLEEKLAKSNDVMAKLREGDWSVLQEDKNQE